MSTLLVSDPIFLEHLVPGGHPERPDRLRAIERALADESFEDLIRHGAPEPASEETIASGVANLVMSTEHGAPHSTPVSAAVRDSASASESSLNPPTASRPTIVARIPAILIAFMVVLPWEGGSADRARGPPHHLSMTRH